MTIPSITPYGGQFPSESDPATFSARANALMLWLVNNAGPEINSAGQAIDAALVGSGDVVAAVADIQSRLAVLEARMASSFIRGVEVFLTTVGSGVWTPPAGVVAFSVEVWGAGGAAGGVQGNGGGSYDAASGGGGAGGYARKWWAHTSGSYSYTIPSGGLSSVGLVAGAAGGDATFGNGGSLDIVAGGGAGGSGSWSAGGGYWAGGVGGAASGGDLNIVGGAGGMGRVAREDWHTAANGGASPLWGGTQFAAVNTAGTDATVPGAGGAGAVVVDVVASYRGGHGAGGMIKIVPYF